MTSETNTEEIPEMNLSKNYSSKSEIPKTNKLQKETEKTRKELEKLKKFIIKKYAFTEAIGILPPQSVKKFIEDELGNVTEADMKNLEKKIHLYVIIPEDKFKEIPKIKTEIVKQMENKKQNVRLHIKTPIYI